MGGFSLPEELMLDEDYKPSPFWDYIRRARFAYHWLPVVHGEAAPDMQCQ
jgi:hypothetical protein